MGKTRVIVALTVGVAVGALLSGTLVAYAASNRTVTVCVTKSGMVRAATAKGKCPKRTSKVSINQTGPAGPSGPAGNPGSSQTTFDRTVAMGESSTVWRHGESSIVVNCGGPGTTQVSLWARNGSAIAGRDVYGDYNLAITKVDGTLSQTEVTVPGVGSGGTIWVRQFRAIGLIELPISATTTQVVHVDLVARGTGRDTPCRIYGELRTAAAS